MERRLLSPTAGRERWWQRVPRPISLKSSDRGPNGAERAASDLVMSEWQRGRQQRLAAFLGHGLETVGEEWVDVSGIMTANVQLTLEQARELGTQLAAVMDGYLEKYRNQTTPGARPVQVHIDVFPLIDGVEQPPAEGGADVGGQMKDET